jgi:hypothetical protein
MALDSPGAPTARVSPDTETEVPNWSDESVLDALRYACWDQVAPSRTNT